VPQSERELLRQEAAEENRQIYRFVLRDGCTTSRRAASAFDQKAESCTEVLCNPISAFSSFPKKVWVVLASVANKGVFRWAPWRKVMRIIRPC
jgi:hypothetical protein